MAFSFGLPLSSGLLSGKINRNTTFAEDDHRNFNRHGEQFDRGETFSGVDFDIALEAVDEIRRVVPDGVSMAKFALRWILDHQAVSCVIPGARNEQQVIQNAAASDLPPLSANQVAVLANLYDEKIRAARPSAVVSGSRQSQELQNSKAVHRFGHSDSLSAPGGILSWFVVAPSQILVFQCRYPS